jgi:hypothetical protein
MTYTLDHRHCGGRQRTLAHTNADTCQEQVSKAACETAGRCHRAPDARPSHDNRTPVQDIAESPYRNTEQCIEHAKRKTLKHADLRVADAQIMSQRLGEQIDHLAIDERHCVR